jgi:hypothetical protein
MRIRPCGVSEGVLMADMKIKLVKVECSHQSFRTFLTLTGSAFESGRPHNYYWAARWLRGILCSRLFGTDIDTFGAV